MRNYVIQRIMWDLWAYLCRSDDLILTPLVRIARIRNLSSISYDVFEGFIWETTITALASQVTTIDQLLFRQFHRLICVYEVYPFHCCCSGKRPASTTITLVGYFSYSTRLSPVNRDRKSIRPNWSKARDSAITYPYYTEIIKVCFLKWTTA